MKSDPQIGWKLITKSWAQITLPADTVENIAAQITVPPMGPRGALRITTRWLTTNNSNIKTARIRFGGAAGTDFGSGYGSASVVGFGMVTHIHNRDLTNSQVGYTEAQSPAGNTLRGVVTSARDTLTAQDIVISMQKATGSDVITLEGYTVEQLIGV